MGTHPIFESDFDCLTEMNRLNLISVRTAKAVSAGAYYRRPIGLRSNLLQKGALVGDGEPVRRGEKIWNENSRNNMQWSCMPGAYSEIIYNKGWAPQLNESAIYAQCDGTVRYTTEIFIPAPGTVESRTIEKMPKGAFIYKLHRHVVPKPQSTVFEMESFL